MTYQEIKDRLSKCEVTLEKLKNGSLNSTDVKQKTEKLEILRESYVKLLKEAEKTAFINGNPVEYEKEDELKKYKDNSDVKTIKTAQGKDIKEQDGAKFSVDETKSIAKSVGKAVAMSLKTLGDEVATMKAKNIEENSFEIYVQYKNDADDQFSFYIVDDTLHLVDFSFDKELTDVGVKPSGEAVVNVDVLANELIKHFKSLNEAEVSEAPEGMYYIKIPKDAASQNKAQVIFNDLYGIKYEINDDPEGIVMYFKKEDFDAGVIDDLEGDGVQILDTNIPMNEEDVKQIEAPEAQGDLDVGHQDDEPNMLKKDLYDVITYASKLYKALDKYDQHDGEVDFPHWWQKKVTLAREYMSAAQHYLEGEEKQPAIDQLALENVGKVNENRFLAASMEDLEQVIRNLAHTGEMSEDEAIELAIRKLEAMLDGRDDMDEGVAKTQKAYGLVVAKMKELAKQYKAGDTSVVAQLKDLTAKKKQLEKQLEKDVAGKNKNQQLDTSINEYRGVQDDLINIIKDKAEDSGFSHEEETEEIIEFLQGIEFDDNGNIDAVYEEEYKGKHQGSNYKWPMSQATKDRKEADKKKTVKEAGPGFKHDCAAKVVHEKYGAGNTIPEKHTLVKEGNKYVVTHYDVLFENGKTVTDIPVSELEIKTQTEHWHKGYKKKKK